MKHRHIPLKALTLTCSLKPSPAESSSEKMAAEIASEMAKYGVETTIIRAVDYMIKPGVEADMGKGDDWPRLRQKMLEADIFILATPTWVGHMSSVAQRIIERLDAELSFADSFGRLETFNKVAVAAVVGNEDGAHKIIADVFQSLNDVGFTIPASGSAYWNGEAMHKTDYKDLDETPEKVVASIRTLAINAVHLARLLKEAGYPAAN